MLDLDRLWNEIVVLCMKKDWYSERDPQTPYAYGDVLAKQDEPEKGSAFGLPDD